MSNDELRRTVLQAVADDYEELEMIISEIVKWTTADGSGTPDRSQIEHTLMASITDKDVQAYLPSEPSGQLVPAMADPQNLHTLWFYITEQGKERLQGLEGAGG
ncbi:MAG: hypothetical protein WAM85_05265 [Terracidiphilus sp.]